ncbi:hypothetical protein CMI41_00770 [Candidatus Pacearchaeota archaeon]|nr:hypothetical protein [Candidatus Pacearchaeota archaeon]|tara:strand:+ start:915 stop:1349 length:435 start_codon:yes stop_codon:yes gene_type:complete
MIRRGNSFVFRCGEEPKFYRALRLLGRLKGIHPISINRLVRHEKEHIEAAKNLSCCDRASYSASVDGEAIVGSVNMGDLEDWEKFYVSLAPRDPSLQDLNCAASACEGSVGNVVHDRVSSMLSAGESLGSIKKYLFSARPASFP